ncbi:hypothetical protein L596_008481 [Steinernema carpocapsae]|uniref:IBB domain-containing protein n=1 Tax=Steinernema carpocapsae TaxID=34508 RepID=A0A4U5PCW4_STECR|nr:hypothetical protein L596_008481 [Steinernema carpocapsae]
MGRTEVDRTQGRPTDRSASFCFRNDRLSRHDAWLDTSTGLRDKQRFAEAFKSPITPWASLFPRSVTMERSEEQETKSEFEVDESLKRYIEVLKSEDDSYLWSEIYSKVRKHVTGGVFLDAEIATSLIELLLQGLQSSNSADAFNCAWALTNIVCESSSSTRTLVRMGGIETLTYTFLTTSERRVQDQCLWALGNIACEDEFLAMKVAHQELLPQVIIILEDTLTMNLFLKQAIWFVHRTIEFCANQLSIKEAVDLTIALIDRSMEFLTQNDMKANDRVAMEALYSLAHLIDVFREPIIDVVLDYKNFTFNLMQILDYLPGHESFRFRKAAMQVIGNLLLGDDHDVGELFDLGLLSFLVIFNMGNFLTTWFSVRSTRKISGFAVIEVLGGAVDLQQHRRHQRELRAPTLLRMGRHCRCRNRPRSSQI